MLGEVNHLFAHDFQCHVGFLGLHGAVSKEHHVVVLIFHACRTCCATRVSCTGVFAYLLDVHHAENLTCNAGFDGVLSGIGDVFAKPNHVGIGLWRFHLTCKVVLDYALLEEYYLLAVGIGTL